MNATDNGPDDIQAERKRLLTEIGRVKAQRNQLQRQLAECRRENLELRAQLERGDS